VTALHHGALWVRDVDASLRFYRDGIGLAVLMDHEFDGPWRELLGGPADRLRSVFLGDEGRPDAGVVELVSFPAPAEGPGATPPVPGFLLLSFYVDVDATLERLGALNLTVAPVRVEVPGPLGPVPMATVRDPDGVLVELIGANPA
jgi:catechol 2,3-dioxygenase-like lactoylglutathione lyase family enzyme